MLKRIGTFFSPPVFPNDEDKTRIAQVLNALLLSATALSALGIIAVFVVFVEKLLNLIFGLVALATFAWARWLMQRGRVRLASVIFVSIIWIVSTAVLSLGGGMVGPIAVFYIANTIVAGTLLGPKAARVHAVVCCLVGLGTIVLEVSGHPLPRLFPVPAITGWGDLIISLSLAIAA